MRIYTVTFAIEDADPQEEVDKTWDEIAKASRLLAHEVTASDLPKANEGGRRIRASERTRVFISPPIELPNELVP